MKKFFLLGLSLLLSVCGFADNVFHSPGAKYAGTPFEYVNISNALKIATFKDDGKADKYGVNENYPWIVYANSGSTLPDGMSEVSRGGYYVSYNPVFFNPEFVYMVDDAQLWLGSPKVEVGWAKGETYFERLVSKNISFYIKEATRIDILLTGAGSNTNVAEVCVLDAADNSVVQTITTEAMPGKSNKAAAANTASQIVAIKGLDAAKSYIVKVAPAASATQLEVAGVDEDGDPVKVYKPFAEVCGDAKLFADVDVAGKNVSNVKAPAVAVAALHIFGTDMSVEPAAPKANADAFHAATSLYPRAPFEYTNLSNALRNDAPKTGYDAEGNPSTANKHAVNDQYPWIYYNYSGSVLDNGQMEVSRGGIYVSKNPVTGADEFVYMIDDSEKSLGSPKVEVGWTKNADNTFNLLPKTITFDVKDTKRVDLLLTGGGSNTNVADIFVINAADKSIVKTIKSEEMPGKSNKANEANTKSQYVTVDGLDEALSYYITVAPAASATTVEISYTDEDGDVVKQYVPFDAAPNFLKDVPNQNISNVKGPSVYVAAIRIFSKDGAIGGQPKAKAASDEAYSPVGKKFAGAAFAYENLSNALCNDAPLTTFNAEGVASTANKYAVNDNYPWISYNYSGSVLDNGKMEVARGGYYFSKDPITGDTDVVYMTDDAGKWLGSPKVETGWAKGETYFNKLMPKSIQFNIKEATKVDFLLTGAGSNNNVADIKVINAADKSVVKTITTEAMAGKSNKNDGSASASQIVAIEELDPTLTYTIVIAPSASATTLEVAGVDEDGDAVKTYKPFAEVIGEGIDLFADVTIDEAKCVSNIKSPAVAVGSIRVWGTDVTEDKALENIIAAAKAAGKNTVVLAEGIDYELNARADANGMTIKGNGAIVTANAEGQLVVKGEGITLDNVNIDCSAGTQAIVAFANKADLTEADTLAYRTWTVDAEGAETMKYPNAANKVLEASAVTVKDCTLKTGGSFISGGDAAWALRTLSIDNSIIGTSAGSGKAFINWEEGASQIKDIVITNSTLFSTVPASTQRFHRYSLQVDPWRVWGYEGDNKNAPGMNTWTLKNNTIVNLCGNKEFSNNIKNTAATTFKFEKNVFVNSWRLNKLGSNVTRDFDYTTNVIAGGVNTVDGTDASKWAVEDTDLGVVYEGIDDEIDFTPNSWSLAAKIGAGAPIWKVEYAENYEISDRVKKGVSTITLDPEKTYTLNAAAVADAQKVVTIKGNGATITVGAEGQFVAQKGIVLDNVVIDAANGTKNLIEMESDAEKLDSLLSTFSNGASKYEGASQNMYEAEKIVISNSTIKNLTQGLVAGNTAKWAVDELTIDNSIINFNAEAIGGGNSNQAAIALAAFKAINVKNSTIYNTAVNTGSYFFRLTNASNAQPAKVWGTGATATVNFEANTFVNALGTKDFANNFVSNASQVTVTLNNNVFYNVFRVKNKFVGNNTFDKEATPAQNVFDHSADYSLDGNENQIATLTETGIVAPTAETGFSMEALGACFGVYENLKAFGDQRWAEYAKPESGIHDVTLENASSVVKKIAGKNGIMIQKNETIYNVAGSRIK